MRTIRLAEPGRFELLDLPAPGEPGPDEALVRVRRIGVCGTDLHAFRGRQPFFSYPRVLGHELAVEVLDVAANGRGIRSGDVCAVEPYLHCGRCVACRRGKTNCCERLRVLGVHVDGGMRDQIVVPVEKLHLSRGLSLDALAVVEMLCIGAHAVRRAAIEPGDDVLVIGAGPIGLSVMAFARLAGGHVAGLELRADRRQFARDHLGIERWVEPRENSGEEAVRDGLGGELPQVVLDATGHPASMQHAFRYVCHGGRLVYVGLFQGDVTFHDPWFHSHEMTLLSSRNATGDDFDFVIDTLASGRLDVAPWITHRLRFEETPEVFPSLLEPENGVVKAEIEL